MTQRPRAELWLGRKLFKKQNLGFLSGENFGPESGDMLRDSSEAHFLCFANTGSGKTRSCVIPNLLQWQGSAVVLDIKGELHEVTARRRREMGQEIVVLDPFDVTGAPPGSLNPLDVFSLANAQTEAESESLAALFAGPKASLTEPFWDTSATPLSRE